MKENVTEKQPGDPDRGTDCCKPLSPNTAKLKEAFELFLNLVKSTDLTSDEKADLFAELLLKAVKEVAASPGAGADCRQAQESSAAS